MYCTKFHYPAAYLTGMYVEKFLMGLIPGCMLYEGEGVLGGAARWPSPQIRIPAAWVESANWQGSGGHVRIDSR